MPDGATLVIARNPAFGTYLEAAFKAAGQPARLVEACPTLQKNSGISNRIVASVPPHGGDGGSHFGAIVLDVHAPYGSRERLQDTPGLHFLADLRRQGYTLPVLLLTWFEPEDFRLKHLSTCLHLFHRYRGGKHEEERGSFAFQQLPVDSSIVVETLGRLRSMTEAEWKEIGHLHEIFPRLHPHQV